MILVKSSDWCIPWTSRSKYEKLVIQGVINQNKERRNSFLPTRLFAFFMRNKLLLIAFKKSEANCPSQFSVCITRPHGTEAKFNQ